MATVQTTRRQAGPGRGTQSRSGLTVMLVVALLISGPVSLGPAGLLPSASAATSHAPIHILDNADLDAQAQAEGWHGAGTAEDPYVVSGYAIEATGAAGIQVDQTTRHLVIRDNVVDGADGSYGIWLNRSHNVRVDDNLVHDASFGIFVDGSQDVHVTGNEVMDSFWGILTISSTGNTVNRNDVHGNHLTHNGQGMQIRFGLDHLVSGNQMVDNDIGLDLHITKRNTIYDNVFENAQNVRRHQADDNTWNVDKTTGPNIIDGAFIGGNHWHDYTGVDLNTDGLGDLAHTPFPSVHPGVDSALGNQGISDGPKDRLPLVDAAVLLGGP